LNFLKNIGKNGKVQTSCIKNFAAMGSRFSELPGITQTGNPKTHWRISFPEWYFTFSKDLYDQLDDFAETLPSVNKDSERIEFSVLRYLTRMAYKTSPFSTFTYLGLTKTAASNNTHSVSADLNCKIRLNNKLLKRVKKLMEQHPALRNLLFVNANSSITEIDGRFTFLMNSANIEVFQEIQAGGINQYIKELIISSEESITLSALSELLSSQIDAELPELQDYLLKLVDVGF
jgi:stage V sporulation protein SpoVS